MRLRAEWKEYCYLCSLEDENPTIGEFARFYLLPAILSILCKLRGHDFIDGGSYATPDSGRECFMCRRCGETHEITYY